MSEKKVVFMVADRDPDVVRQVSEFLRAAFDYCVVYLASEGSDTIAKMRINKPDLLVIGLDLGRMTGGELVRLTSQDQQLSTVPILVLSDLPEPPGAFADDMADGRLKFVSRPVDREALIDAASKALQIAAGIGDGFVKRRLSAEEWLFREGEIAECAFLVKSGKLRASKKVDGKVISFGEVLAGEFVGEMAHITGEPRSADVQAIVDCELVEIPLGTLDLLIFSKPTWSKALLKTLCRRLREANQKKS